jgi:hypothetical protein
MLPGNIPSKQCLPEIWGAISSHVTVVCITLAVDHHFSGFSPNGLLSFHLQIMMAVLLTIPLGEHH